MTTFIVHDTLSVLRPYYLSTDAPKARFQAVMDNLLVEGGLMRRAQFAGVAPSAPMQVMQTALIDGGATLGQQGFGLFNPTRKTEVSALILEQCSQMNILERVHTDLTRFAAAPSPFGATPDQVEIYVFPTDPANRAQMLWGHGITGFAFTPGVIVWQFFPSIGNMVRLSASLARWWIHQCWLVERGEPVTLRDWLRLEGMAARFAEMVCPELTIPAWMTPFHPADDWGEVLATVAGMYGVASYSAMKVNTYGQNEIVGDERPPLPAPMDAELHELVQSVIEDGLDETIPQHIAAYLYGDALVTPTGHSGVGLPPYAGYEVATAFT